MIPTLKRLLAEPLLHFLLLGTALFVAYSLIGAGGSSGPGRIVVTQGQIESLATGFTNAWQRPPTAEELSGLVRDHVREEVYYREALAMGLDKDDTVIRRRLRQKMEFITDDIAVQATATDDELNAYLLAHPDAFRTPDSFAFNQVYLNPAKHGDRLASDAADLLARLNRPAGNADVSTLGDPLMLEHDFAAESVQAISAQFGNKFAAKLGDLEPGRWQGPVESGFGVHLVRVNARTPASLPPLAQVRDAVVREFSNARRLQTNETFYQELLKRYTVTIEPPLQAEEPAKLASVR